MRLIGDQGYEGSAQTSGTNAGVCRHVLLLGRVRVLVDRLLASGSQGREAPTARTCRRGRQGQPAQVDGTIVTVGDRLLGARLAR